MIRNPNTSPAAVALWSKRAHAMKEGTDLLTDKPNREQWSDQELRIWRYATAISHRLDKLQ